MAHMNKKISIAIVVILLGLTSGILVMMKKNQETKVSATTEEQHDYHQVEVNGKSYEYNSSLVGILLLGVDSSDTKNLGQADFISLLLMDREKETMKLLSISRDTMTQIQLKDASGNDLGWDTQHLALSYAYGSSEENGSMLTMSAVSKLLNDIPVINFVTADVSTIASFQNIVGNLNVVVPDDSLSYLNMGWDEGKEITLTADTAEKFLRSRNTNVAYSSEMRRMRQKAYMDAYIKKLKSMLTADFQTTVKKMASVYDQVTTNLSLNELDAYAEMVMTYDFDTNGFYNLTGKEKQGDFHDEYWIDESAKNDLILRLFYKER